MYNPIAPHNMWFQIMTTKVHYQMGALSKQDYIDLLNVYFKQAVQLQKEAHDGI